MSEQHLALSSDELTVLFPGQEHLPATLPDVRVREGIAELAINDGVRSAYGIEGIARRFMADMRTEPSVERQKEINAIGMDLVKRMAPRSEEATCTHTAIPGVHPAQQLAVMRGAVNTIR